MTEARRVADLFLDPPREAEWRPVLRGVSRLAFGTLPPMCARGYGLPVRPGKGRDSDGRRSLRSGHMRPFLPPKYRFIAPYQQWRRRERGQEGDGAIDERSPFARIRL